MTTVAPATTIARPTVADAAPAPLPGPARLTLGTLAADIEQRVVDPDRESDHHHDRRSGRPLGNLRNQAQRPQRGRHRGHAEHQRHAAAATAPKASTRINSVSGTEISSAWRKPASTVQGWRDIPSHLPTPGTARQRARCEPRNQLLQRHDARVGIRGIGPQRHDDEPGRTAGPRRDDRVAGFWTARTLFSRGHGGRVRRPRRWSAGRCSIHEYVLGRWVLDPRRVRRASAGADAPTFEAALDSSRVPDSDPSATQPTRRPNQRATVSRGRREARRAAEHTSRATRPAGGIGGVGEFRVV